jgi:serine/threonine protein kinase
MLATQKITGERVAIKIVKKHAMEHIEMTQMRREIEVLKMCQHPNIIKLIGLYETQEQFFIVMDLMEGKDLYTYLEKRKFKLSEQRIAQISYQIALAI